MHAIPAVSVRPAPVFVATGTVAEWLREAGAEVVEPPCSVRGWGIEALPYAPDEPTNSGLDKVRAATAIVERALGDSGAFQYMAILHEDRVTGMVDGQREFGRQIEIRCWDSVDARTATPTELPFAVLTQLAQEIVEEVPGIVSVTYNVATKPPSTIEVV